MHPPCEMMVERFLPAMRILVARRLDQEGFSQGRIASLLGVTQASVSFYLSGSPSKPMRLVSSLGLSEEEAGRYSALLSEDVKKNPVYAVSTLYSIWADLLGRGAMCGAHRSDHAYLSQCDVCMRIFGEGEARGDEAVRHVSEAIAIIESSSALVHIMPQISVNVAYAQEDAETVDEVVAVPGRIVRIRDRPRAFMRPEFGASRHLALVLLLVKGRMKHLRAAINLRYDAKMERIMKNLKIKTLKIGGSYPKDVDDPVAELLRSKMAGTHESFEAIAALGGQGLEPSLYLFGPNAVEVTKLALKIARMYSVAS